ncbi:hypothetical protein [Arthrobacter sp. JSM 101049]|uniref:hypothetical protein n=1 Tax=Arthrobacter sp. JSM 101049 TaxID=929097 RepID=UPI003569EDAD
MEVPWTRDVPTAGSPVWERLARLVDQRGLLLHGSRTPGLATLEPAAPLDRGPDVYSKSTAVFATEDPTWAMGYALRDESCLRLLNACFHPLAADGSWGPRRIFLSYARPASGTPPLSRGVVYAVPRGPFTRMPPHDDPALGSIVECQWIATDPVPVMVEIVVEPLDMPFAVRTHDHDRVSAAMDADPSGFPWLDA